MGLGACQELIGYGGRILLANSDMPLLAAKVLLADIPICW